MYFLRQFRDQGQASLRIQHDLMPRTLEIAFKSFPILNFSWGACPQTPLAKGALWPLVNTVAYSTQTGCQLQNLLKPLAGGIVYPLGQPILNQQVKHVNLK